MLEEGQDRGGDTAELGALFEAHGPYVQRVLRRFGVPESDVADVAQDVFVIVCRKLDGFEGRSSLRTWLYRICARTAIDHHHRAYRRYERLTDPPDVPTTTETQVESLAMRRTADAVRGALDELSDDKRAVFVLYELEEMTMAEVALVVRCPLQTAFSRLYAARKHVNKALARAGWVGAGLAVGVPSRTAWAATPELHAVVATWRATLPGAFTLAKLGTGVGLASQGVVAMAAAACFAAVAATMSASTPVAEADTSQPSAPIAGIAAVIEHGPHRAP